MKLSREHRIAKKIAELTNDVTIDLDQVGAELARMRPIVSYNRLMLVAEAAAEEQEKIYVKEHHTPLF
jgi:D-alanyl-D-alanine dipeptidase